ncbi:MAG: hypothetical protein JW884_04640 [Deltaproteobacteria bacterium]|nr:hypothetical protein [Deltaproteobacteria bacterium]
MKRICAVILATLTICTTVSIPSRAHSKELTILYTGDLLGHLTPAPG